MLKKSDSQISAFGLTDVGLCREKNEDTFSIDDALGLYMVSDGMGGHAAGDVASQLSTECIQRQLRKFAPDAGAKIDGDAIKEVLIDAVISANQAIFDKNREWGLTLGAGMGTAIAGVWLVPHSDVGWFFHVGDCRVYLYREGNLVLLTQDHTLYEQWKVEGGKGMPPNKNIVLRALGPWPKVDVDVQRYHRQPGDVLLICSDGLTGMVSDDEIAQEIAMVATLGCEQVGRKLIAKGNASGGEDNITVLLASILNS